MSSTSVTNNLIKKLGQGSFGTVYLAKKPDGCLYAVKVLSESRILGFTSVIEVDIMRRLVHPNLMYSLGVDLITTQKSKNIGIEMPLATSDLKDYLKNRYPTINQKIKIFFDIVNGVHFLHINRLLHLDLKPRNILITTDGNNVNAFVSDFGFVIMTDRSGNKYFNKELITITYRPPELFKRPLFYTPKADIWSLGIILLEILIPNINIFPYNKNIPQHIDTIFNDADRYKNLVRYLAPINDKYKLPLADLLYSLLSINPSERPSTDQILTNPLFNDLISAPNIQGYVNQPSIVPAPRCQTSDLNNYFLDYMAFDFMFKVAYSMNVKAETVFLASDLYQRALYLQNPFTGNDNVDWSNTLLLMMSCYWIAIKLIEYITINANHIVSVSNSAFTVDDLLNMELALINSFNGILYRWNIFTYSQCFHQLLDGFELLRQCHLYHKVNLETWSKLPVICNPKLCTQCNFDLRFSLFFPQTKYFKFLLNSSNCTPNTDVKKILSTRIIPNTSTDCIYNLIKTDLSSSL